MQTQIEIFKVSENSAEVEVRFKNESIWLNQKQMGELFDKDSDTIGLHLKNIFAEEELQETLTTEYFSVVQKEGKREVKRNLKFYNLDAIISVGYRVNSKRGTQFRQWATQKLNEYLIKGFVINKKRLDELGKTVQIIEAFRTNKNIQSNEAEGLLKILSNYTKTFVLLNQFDSNRLPTINLNENITYEIQYKEAISVINELKKQLIAKKEATDLFGNQKDEGFKSTLKAIVQTFDGRYLYPSIEEQAAHLLYFVIKNHSFSDGNKRIGVFLFVWFLEKNKHLLKQSGEVKVNDNALIAIALLVAQSDPEDKNIMVQLISNLINGL
jgi:death-on-curing family protein